ncbi:MAG: long-chain fatty acid transporter [Thiobacillus sp. 63-78]|uniref:OmpP1/FadL family transporter n=1 Tax=Thiobacillus sp. 63-78 TaxID=1895859 RepID=UPI000960151D|nr:outer membrane protein transport protein [Thiobacillus sp. 63-78]OJZ11765.1 MAG: long-chain fatty acid transporter [Thiobacillus sp. 63-78]
MKFTRVFAFMALAGLAGSAFATDGYFSHGYGMKAKGMGGAATASSDDAFFGANNPAAAAFAGNRLDLGADLFSPRREASRTGLGPLDASVDSDSKYFLIPEFGYNHMLNPDVALGVTVYGNGGMNSNYPGGQINCGTGAANLLCGSGKLGVDLMQLIVAPTAAYKLAPNHSIGISPLIGYQRFKANGLQAFQMTPGVSSDPVNVTNRGYDDSFGYGVRIGYMGKIAPTVTIGAAYASKMQFDEFSKYKGLFAEQGGFDIPENYNLGVAWQATPAIQLAVDYQRINYSGVNSIGNPSTNMAQLGADNGPGFGWQDVDVWKLGVQYKYSQKLTLRAGYNHTDNPIASRDVTFNILAPGVVKDHATLGFTYTTASGNEWTMAYMHAFKNDVTGTSILPAFSGNPPSGTEKIEMYQNSLGIQYSWKM